MLQDRNQETSRSVIGMKARWVIFSQSHSLGPTHHFAIYKKNIKVRYK